MAVRDFSERFRGVSWSVLAAAMFALTGAKAQDKGEPISVHVKEVHRSQEGDENGTIFHFTAVVESKSVIYSISCDEVYSREKRAYTARCFRLSAGKDYSVRRFPDAMNFWPPEDRGEGYLLVMYDVVSEKEK
jgi:hypothetical protein